MFDENDTVITEFKEIDDAVRAMDMQAYKNHIRRKEWEAKAGIDTAFGVIHVPLAFPLGALIELCKERGYAAWQDDDGSYHIEHCSMLDKQAG